MAEHGSYGYKAFPIASIVLLIPSRHMLAGCPFLASKYVLKHLPNQSRYRAGGEHSAKKLY